jgi:hypothetical protein
MIKIYKYTEQNSGSYYVKIGVVLWPKVQPTA